MSTSYVCGRCSQRIALYCETFSRGYSSSSRLEKRHESAISRPERGPRDLIRNYGEIGRDQRGRNRSSYQYHKSHQPIDDNGLETLFSTNLIAGEDFSRSPFLKAASFHINLTGDEPRLLDPPTLGRVPAFNELSSTSESRRQHNENIVRQPSLAVIPEDTNSAWKEAIMTVTERLSRQEVLQARDNFTSTYHGGRPGTKKIDWLSKFQKSMDIAVRRSNAGYAVEVWTKAQRYLDRKRKVQDLAKVENLFAKFLSAFFELKQPETAISIWNYMVQNGYRATNVHWITMLHGCIRARDASSLKVIWDRMQKSNVVVDTATWTTYVGGLIKCRHWQEGIDALGQLGRIWRTSTTNFRGTRRHQSASVKGEDQEERPTPSLVPVKATLNALVAIGKYDLLESVLGWASSHGLQPDAHTYNILLRPIARKGNLTAIQTHLTKMSLSDCQPDVTTFSIILSALFSSVESDFLSLTTEEQESIILLLLDNMRAAGVQPNAYMYSTLCSSLLRPHPTNQSIQDRQRQPSMSLKNINITVARTLLTHMRANSIQPTPHIYTILLSHYFSHPQPDLGAIHSLWRSMQQPYLAPGTSPIDPDPIFYDTMISGLAKLGQAEDSLRFIVRMVKDGKVPSWVALGNCLDALHKDGKWGRVRWLIREVERKAGLLKWGERGLRGKSGWVGKVVELRREGIVPARVDGGGVTKGGRSRL